MKVVILAGGLGSRLSELTDVKPKPMVEIGGRPILWHIMKTYAAYGFNEFVICAGYKSYVIKDFFNNYYLQTADVTFDLANNHSMIRHSRSEPWQVTVVDTGLETMTGGRLKRVEPYLDDTFCLTYGDGVSDIDISALIEFHNNHGKLATMTAVQPAGRFGSFTLDDQQNVSGFREKPTGDHWINGGFFVLEREVLDYIKDDTTIFEHEPLTQLGAESQLKGYSHSGFWACMDTVRDRNDLEAKWDSGNAPWKKW